MDRARIFSVSWNILSETRNYIGNHKILKSKTKLIEEISVKITKIKKYRKELDS